MLFPNNIEKDPRLTANCSLDHIFTLVGSSSKVPVTTCDIRRVYKTCSEQLLALLKVSNSRYHNAQECKEESFGDYLAYWKGDRKEGTKYLKDWHFHRLVRDRYTAYTTPKFFSSDWLNEWWEIRGKEEIALEQKNAGENSERSEIDGNDYRFVYIGPRGSWTPLHCDVFGSYSWSANIVGKKKWFFWKPGEEPRDHRGELLWRVDEEVHDERRLEVEQLEGQVIFVPSGWHHQVTNIEDTVSINHNWFNGSNIEEVVLRLEAELKKVQKELDDCKGEGWDKMCQQLLKDSYGMNLEDLVDLLATVMERRLSMLEQPEYAKVSFDKAYLGPIHAKYDIVQVKKALIMLIRIFEENFATEKYTLCQHLINKCSVRH